MVEMKGAACKTSLPQTSVCALPASSSNTRRDEGRSPRPLTSSPFEEIDLAGGPHAAEVRNRDAVCAERLTKTGPCRSIFIWLASTT